MPVEGIYSHGKNGRNDDDNNNSNKYCLFYRGSKSFLESRFVQSLIIGLREADSIGYAISLRVVHDFITESRIRNDRDT